jgi:hypothetical protein
MSLLTTIGLLAIHAVSLYGWGRAFERRIGLEHAGAALAVALGLALVIVLGGVLNVASIAYAPALWVTLGVGLTLAMRHGTKFVTPVRMPMAIALRVYGSSVSAIGFETLGGQAWLHGFVLNVGGVDALNAVDLGLGLSLCIALAGFAPASTMASAVAVLAVLVLNPQIVNISSTYTASALCLALIMLNLGQAGKAAEPTRAHAIAAGLIFAALSALKTTFILVAGVLGIALTLALAARTRSLSRALRWSSLCAATTLFGVLPWLLVHARSYLAALHSPGPELVARTSARYFVHPLSLDPVLYGDDSFAVYTLAVACCLSIAVFAWFAGPSADGTKPWLAHVAMALSIGLACIYFVMLYVIAPRSQGAVTIMRLFAPILIGILPGLVLTTANVAQPTRRATMLVPLALAVAALLPFGRGPLQRMSQAIGYGSILGFPALATDPDYLRYNHDVLYGPMRQRVAVAQAAVPRGAPILAWINTPFLLDFRRNPIADLEPAGLVTPWASIPSASYVIWELNGFATTQPVGYRNERNQPALLQARIGEAGLRLTYAMIELARNSQVVRSDGQFMVLRLATRDALRQRYWALADHTRWPAFR